MATSRLALVQRGSTRTESGTLTVILGCMFSGKTTALIGTLARYPTWGVRTFKHLADCRYARDAVVSHDGRSIPATPIALGADLCAERASGALVVGIDEGHFFDESLLVAVGERVREGVDVVLTTLDLDCQGRPFPMVERLRRAADRVVALTARCARCGAVADRTQRIVALSELGYVGGAESYEPRCSSCWELPPGIGPRFA